MMQRPPPVVMERPRSLRDHWEAINESKGVEMKLTPRDLRNMHYAFCQGVLALMAVAGVDVDDAQFDDLLSIKRFEQKVV